MPEYVEAMIRALRTLEPDNMDQLIEETLLKVLRAMAGFQASFMKPMPPQPKMGKKKKVPMEMEIVYRQMEIDARSKEGTKKLHL
jgi:hypothetical protein